MRLNYFLILMIFVQFFVIGVLFYQIRQPKVVSFDFQKIQGDFVQQLVLHKASDVQITNATKRFKNLLNKVLAKYSNSHKTIIIDSKYIYKSNIDITDEIALKVSEAMRSSK